MNYDSIRPKAAERAVAPAGGRDASAGEPSAVARADGSPTRDWGPQRNACQWCHAPIPLQARRDSKFCGKRCRQASWRFKVPRAQLEATDQPMTFAYADPPYPGKARYYPERQEVDHAALIAHLTATYPDGWALSTSARALRDILPLCPPGTRVCAWLRKPRPTRSRSALSSWEPLLVAGGRPLDASVVQDLTDALIARGRWHAFPGAITGMKPPTFAVWLFRLLGARRGDHLDDLFPGSGAVSLAWQRYTSRPPAGATRRKRIHATPAGASRGPGTVDRAPMTRRRRTAAAPSRGAPPRPNDQVSAGGPAATPPEPIHRRRRAAAPPNSNSLLLYPPGG